MEKNLDLLLVNVGGTKKKVYQDLSESYSAIEPPFWAALTAGFIRKKGFGVRILDANAENITHHETVEAIKKYNPEYVNIVAYGQQPAASTQLMTEVGKLCKIIKKNEPNQKVILTGLHPSALPLRTMEEEVCDFVGQGEGFHTLLGLLEKEQSNKIPGLWWRDNGEIRGNPRPKNIVDLTKELSDVAWDLLPMDKYLAHNWHCLEDLDSRTNYASISTNLGCPFSCDFCAIHATFGERKMRSWDPKWVLNQLDILVKDYGVKNVKIIDELFVVNPNHFMPIVEGLIEKDYGLNIWAYSRIDTVKKEYLSRLKKAGFNWLAYGTETSDDEIRKNVSKGQFTKSDIKRVVKETKGEGINIVGHCMFGLPGDTKESMQQNLDFAIEMNYEWNTIFCTVAYPGSPLYKRNLKEGIKMPDKWVDFSQHGYNFVPLPTKNLTPAQILEFRDNAFNKYYTNPKYLKMIQKKFGAKAKKHIEEMTKVNLKRKLLGD